MFGGVVRLGHAERVGSWAGPAAVMAMSFAASAVSACRSPVGVEETDIREGGVDGHVCAGARCWRSGRAVGAAGALAAAAGPPGDRGGKPGTTRRLACRKTLR